MLILFHAWGGGEWWCDSKITCKGNDTPSNRKQSTSKTPQQNQQQQNTSRVLIHSHPTRRLTKSGRATGSPTVFDGGLLRRNHPVNTLTRAPTPTAKNTTRPDYKINSTTAQQTNHTLPRTYSLTHTLTHTQRDTQPQNAPTVYLTPP